MFVCVLLTQRRRRRYPGLVIIEISTDRSQSMKAVYEMLFKNMLIPGVRVSNSVKSLKTPLAYKAAKLKTQAATS